MNYIELLPGSAFGHILDHLNSKTGSKGIINHADIPVIIRYAYNLANTSKTIAAKVNDIDAVQLFLTSLSCKYNQSCVYFASMLNTIGTRKWMWNNIHANGDAKAYQVDIIQDIFEVILGVLKEDENANLYTAFSYKPRTEQGFVLSLVYPRQEVITSLGKIAFCFVDSKRAPMRLSYSNKVHTYLETRLKEIIKNIPGPVLSANNPYEENLWFIWETLKTERLGLDPTPIEPKTPHVLTPPLFNHISQLSKWAVDRAAELEKRPHHSYTNNGYTSLKRLKLESDYVDTLCALSLAAEKFLNVAKNWVLCSYKNDPGALYLERSTVNGFPDRSTHYVKPLKAAYDSVIKQVGTNWIQAELKDYPDLVNIYSEEDFVLYVKTKNLLTEEDILINNVAVQLGLSTSLCCGTSEKSLYLWVKKEGLEKTLAALNIPC